MVNEIRARIEPGSDATQAGDMNSGSQKAAADDGAIVRIEGLTKRFERAGGGHVVPVDDVTLEVAVNDFVVLLGPSGCGKTTLLRCVAGLERPDEGRIYIGGELVFCSERKIFVPPNKRHISMIFQTYALWPHMTVFANVAYALKGKVKDKSKIREMVLTILELVGLDGLEDQHPGRISGGQQQRVALARALVGDPTVILFDEPLSNVDALVRQHLRLELVRMHRELGFCALYVTHDQTEAMELARRIAVLEDGHIAALDSPQGIYDEPPSRGVAEFIGSANVWEGVLLTLQDGSGVVETDEMGPVAARVPVGVVDGSDGSMRAGDPVVVVARPERLMLSTTDSARGDGPNSWLVQVEASLFSGVHTSYLLTRGDSRIQAWNRGPGLEEGADVWLTACEEDLLILPR